MKTTIKTALTFGIILILTGCGGAKDLPTFVPEENGLNLVKLTDETKGSVIGPGIGSFNSGAHKLTKAAGSKKAGISWATIQALRTSPKGDELAHLTEINNKQNIFVRKARSNSAPTQRTFKNVDGFCWGNDDMLYFAEEEGDNTSKISAVNAHKGSIIRQITTSNQDYDPALSEDGTLLFFTRMISGTEPMIWSYNLKTGEMTNCTRGYNPAVIGDSKEEVICVRNNEKGQSEIWRVNFQTGTETILLTDTERSYSNPQVSPDQEWIVFQGNSVSSLNKKKNLDLFAMRLDGSDFMQLTFHPGNDTNPQWSTDGQEIYFISDRANKKDVSNIWKMKFKPF